MPSTLGFQDHFSQQAQDYARYRPSYPDALFAYLASIVPGHGLAWDCGTGNGQAALALAAYFNRVLATDASADQIQLAFAHQRVEYRVEPAEQVSLDSGTVDLVTVAIALHWFEFDSFYREVRRVLKPGGILAVWAYHLPQIDPQVDRLLAKYYYETLAGYWAEQVRYLDQRYRTLPFPFFELEPPAFEMVTQWNLSQVGGFLNSWSATRKYLNQLGAHPVKLIWPDLAAVWGPPEDLRTLHWPLYLRVGKVIQT